MLLDEWQIVPEVLAAVKRAVDSDRRPGRFLITGSNRRDTSDRFWAGTGRVVMVYMQPLTVAEMLCRPSGGFVDRVVSGDALTAAAGRVLDRGT